MSDLGLYFHLPFCLKKCNYCDFCSYVGREADMHDYVTAMLAELQYRAAALSVRRRVDTVFFGGGTPSLLATEEIARILAAVERLFELSPDAEITLEANPASADEAKLRALHALGINRLSMGVQSFSDEELAALGRLHNTEEARAFFACARRAGFDNINLDLMYAIPSQTLRSLEESIRAAIELAPEHISAYGLILEEGTPLYTACGGLSPHDGDEEADMNALLCRLLAEAGYHHYEISNFAKHGRECRHNLHYWRCEEYLGLGVAAHSYVEGVRFGNARDLDEYLAAPCDRIEESTSLTLEDAANEQVMLGLRLAEGVDLAAFRARFGKEVTDSCDKETLRRLEAEGYIRREQGRLSLSEKGMMISNAILLALL